MLKFIKPISILLVFVTASGVLLHDMKIDKATTLAMAAPALAATAGALTASVAKMDHVHVERASAPKMASIFSSSLPKVYPPRDDDKRYIQSKKSIFMTGGSDRSVLWPSV